MPERPAARTAGEPLVAVLLTWFLPGAGHLYLGRVRSAAVGFLLVEGLYALGWLLSEGRVFEFLDPELRGPLATVLAPEVGNLGAMLLQLRLVGFGAEPPVPFAAWVELGGMLTAVSGIANVFLMAHAHLEARTTADAPRAGRHPVLLGAAAWAVPGLGHFLSGRGRRGAVVFVLLVGVFLAGTWMAEGSNLSRQRHFYYWSGQTLLGAPALAAELLSGRPPVRSPLPLVDYGLLYGCMAGLLNVLAILDVFGVAERRWLGLPAPGAEREPAGMEEAA